MTRRINVVILGLASLLTDISTEMVYPLLPLFPTRTLGASPAIVGLIEGLHATLVGIGLFPASALAGWLWTAFGPSAPFYFGGALGCAAAAALHLVLRVPKTAQVASPQARGG